MDLLSKVEAVCTRLSTLMDRSARISWLIAAVLTCSWDTVGRDHLPLGLEWLWLVGLSLFLVVDSWRKGA